MMVRLVSRDCRRVTPFQHVAAFMGLAVVESAEMTEVYVNNFRAKISRLLDEIVMWESGAIRGHFWKCPCSVSSLAVSEKLKTKGLQSFDCSPCY